MSRGLQMLKEQCNIKMYDELRGMVIPKEYFHACVKGAEGVFVIPPDRIDAEFLDAAGKQFISPMLQLVAASSALYHPFTRA